MDGQVCGDRRAAKSSGDLALKVLAVAVVIWVATLVWLIGEGIRMRGLRGGPAIGDSAKTHSFWK